MRTTLKRGVGRSAVVNGDGRAVLPPGALSPVVLYRQSQPRHRGLRRLAKAFVWLVALAVMVVTALAASTVLYVEDTTNQIQARSAAVKATAKQLDIPLPGRPAIALVVGYDRRAGEGADVPTRSDTIMLVRADPEQKTLSLLSFPRDLGVDVHCPGRDVIYDRINAAYALCKFKGTVATVKALTGLPINYLVTVNFRGFTQVVDKLGGVWIDVDRRYFNDNSGYGERYAAINLQPGYQKLYGGDALAFVRYRHTDNDLIRNARQQIFVRALKERISSSFQATTIPKVVGALRRNIEVQLGGGRELEEDEVLSWALLAYQLPSGNVFRVKLDGLTGSGSYGDLFQVDPASLQEAIDQFVNPDVDAPEKAAAAALGQRARLKRLSPRQISLVVLNGNNVDGAAANAGALLRDRGYRTLLPPEGMDGNAPNFDYFRTQVYYGRKRPRAKEAARQVANLFGSADFAPMPRGEIARKSNGAMLVVVVGETFKGTLAPSPKDRTPERQTPEVVHNPDAARAQVREAQKRVDFRLMLPTRIEKNSTLDTDGRAVRVYKIDGEHKAVRLVFRTWSNEYWGIEQMDWDDAPVFEGRNTERRLDGRTYELYFSGTHLHMVILRDGERSYWVVNTLLDKLSNETMLAIARGLRPLKK